MSSKTIKPEGEATLRMRAVSRLRGASAPKDERASSSAALGALYELASSPATAANALALLHELQVHQVEVEMQDEELRNSHAELEAALFRQIQLYDALPVGCFTVDSSTVMHELNLTGARLLGFERSALLGRALEGFLAEDSVRVLKAMLTRIGEGGSREACALELTAGEGAHRIVHATANADPSSGGRFLVAVIEIGAHGEARGTV